MDWRGLLIMSLMTGLLGGCGERAETTPTATPAATPPATSTPAAPAPGTTTPPAPATRTCPVCKQPVPAEAKYCRACGSRQP